MVDQAASHAALVNASKIYYSKKILKDFDSKLVWYSNAPVMEPIDKGMGKVIEFTRYQKIAGVRADDSTEFASQQLYLSATIVQATLKERSGYVQLSSFADLTLIGGIMDRAMSKVKDAAGKSVDRFVRNSIGMAVVDVANASSVNMDNLAIDGGTLNSSGITARLWSHDKAAAGDRFPMYHNKARVAQSALVTSIAASGLTVKTVNHAVTVLQGKDVEALPSGKYNMIAHTDIPYQLTSNPGFKGWVSYTSGTSAVKQSPNEITDVISGVTIKTSTLGYKFPLSGDTLSTASGNLYASLLYGDEAFGVSEVSGKQRKGFELYLKESGPQSTNDPANKLKIAAFKFVMAAKILNKSAGLFILTTGK
ncbi:MAG: hypothetical protein UR84_C0022G0010 [candidate division WS6 bacterium GW2011_GWD1_35_594]|nr:MAG: hypothetical protein UR43_C0027G0002 [candidate division TM6 bacterium GW2011_GWF2_33_332]KKP81563.1 MAG: hypothetical protein UR84_C0022G0010 [candidate division WS6 bacterium GW2011_GWD1_35_594]